MRERECQKNIPCFKKAPTNNRVSFSFTRTLFCASGVRRREDCRNLSWQGVHHCAFRIKVYNSIQRIPFRFSNPQIPKFSSSPSVHLLYLSNLSPSSLFPLTDQTCQSFLTLTERFYYIKSKFLTPYWFLSFIVGTLKIIQTDNYDFYLTFALNFRSKIKKRF